MDGADLHRLLDDIVGVPADCADRERLQSLLGDVHRLKSWCQGRELWAAKRLKEASPVPEMDSGAGTDLAEAMKLAERADTVAAIPGLGEALDAGVVSAGHVDVL